MMSLSSSQAGIVGARRKKLNQTEFSSYRYVKVEYNSPVSFVENPPSAQYPFTARHIYSYSKINNTFTFLGVQKAQSLIREKEWVNQLVFTDSDPAILDGTYIRSDVNSTVYWKNGIPNSDPNIAFENPNIWFFRYSQAPEGTAAVLYSNLNEWNIISRSVAALSNPEKYYTNSTSIDNTTLKNINNNRLYSTKDADLGLPEQIIFPDVNFNINTANIFDTKNLAHNEKVFIDVRWINFVDGERNNYDGWWTSLDEISFETGLIMNNRKGNIYRAGVLIKDNTIDSMLYHTDLATNEALINKMQHGKDLTLV